MVDLSLRITGSEDDFSIVELHPEGPLSEFFGEELDDYKISFVINVLSAALCNRLNLRKKQEDEERQKELSSYRGNEYYQHIRPILDSLPRDAGVYKIVCSSNGCVYVGASLNIRARVTQHFTEMSRVGSRHALACDYQEYGPLSFSAEVIESISDTSTMSAREQYWTDHYSSAGIVYNKTSSRPHPLWMNESGNDNG